MCNLFKAKEWAALPTASTFRSPIRGQLPLRKSCTISPMAMFHPVLQLPDNVLANILPDPNISVLEYIKFSLPIVQTTKKSLNSSAFYDTQEPTTMDFAVVSSLPVPPKNIILALSSTCAAAAVSGIHSVRCPHILPDNNYRLPLWTIIYWIEVEHLRTTSYNLWIAAESEFASRQDQRKQAIPIELRKEAYRALSTIRWSGQLHGFPASGPVSELSTYLTRAWLHDVHENQMLHLLAQRLRLDPAQSGIRIRHTFFLESLRYAFNGRASYANDQSSRWLQELGSSLSKGDDTSELATIANVNGNHWITVVLNFKNKKILYGDSLLQPLQRALYNQLQWWTYFHTHQSFDLETLQTVRQVEDHSCGVHAGMCLFWRYFPNGPMTVGDEDAKRLRVMLEVIKFHMDHEVRTIKSDVKTAADDNDLSPLPMQ